MEEKDKTEENLEILLKQQIQQNKRLTKFSLGLSSLTLSLAGFILFTLNDNLSSLRRDIYSIKYNVAELNNMEKDNSQKVSLQDKVLLIESVVKELKNKLDDLDIIKREISGENRIYTKSKTLNEKISNIEQKVSDIEFDVNHIKMFMRY